MVETTITGETVALLTLARQVEATGYAFVTPTPATLARVNARPGNSLARTVRDVFGWSRPFRDGVVPDGVMEAMRAAGVLERHAEGWRSLVRLSSLDGLLFLHSAYPTTAADAVFFGPDTYRFCSAIAAAMPARVTRAVDIGCGAGPGAVVVARRHPEATVFGVDINPVALRMTRANAALAGVAVTAIQSDLLSGLDGLFDLIVANPPYLVDPSERAYRHGGGPLGAGLSLKVLDAAIERLETNGRLILYTGAAILNGADPFHEAASARLAGSGLRWRYSEIDPDVFGEELGVGAYAEADRIAAVLLIADKPG